MGLRRWPIEIPRWRAFCLRAPGVRLSALEITTTGVLSLECFFSALSSCAVHSRRTTRLAISQLHVDSSQAIYQVLCRGGGLLRIFVRPGIRFGDSIACARPTLHARAPRCEPEAAIKNFALAEFRAWRDINMYMRSLSAEAKAKRQTRVAQFACPNS